MPEKKHCCYRCGKDLQIKPPVGRSEVCPFCGVELRCCLNCGFQVSGIYNDCREPQAERVTKKERGNFCGFFFYRDAATEQAGKEPPVSAKAKLDALFK